MAKFDEIEKYLKQNGVNFEVINLPSTAISVDDVVRLTGGQIKREEIVKTLIVKLKSGDFIACLLKGDNRLKKCNIIERLALNEEVLKITKVKPGAVCPILIGIPVIVDQKVMELKRVNMGSGDHLKGLEMDLSDLLKVLSDYIVEEISL